MKYRRTLVDVEVFDVVAKEGWTPEEVIKVLEESRGWTLPEMVDCKSTGRKLIQTCLKSEDSKEDDHIDGVTVTIGWMENIQVGHKLTFDKCESGGMADTPVLEAGAVRCAGSSPASRTVGSH